MTAPLPVFLSAYDPAELPGGTVDPLGFTAGYLALADALFPGMTAAAAQATYFPMLCAGLSLAETHGALGGLSVTAARKRRIEIALRFERLWALACALQVEPRASSDAADGAESGDEADQEAKVRGVRGIRYVERERRRLEQTRAETTGTEFALLAVQYRYGVFGIYGGVAEGFGLLDKSSLALTAGIGDAIGEGFLDATCEAAERKELARAAAGQMKTIRLKTLKAWGARAHAGAPLRGTARAMLTEALLQDRRRARMFALLERVTANCSGPWSDRLLLEACAAATPATEPALFTALEAALAYDAFLRSFTLLFERVLWLCRSTVQDAAEAALVFADPVIVETCAMLGERGAALLATAERLFAAGNRDLTLRGRGILELARDATSSADVARTVRAVVARHAKIQRAKREFGRPKLPWLEERGTTFALTSARSGNRSSEPRRADDLRAPDWRFGAALSFLDVLGGLQGAAQRFAG